MGWLCSSLSLLFTLAFFAFWIWMILECVRKDPDRLAWLIVLLFLPFVGPVIYFLARWLPANETHTPRFVQRFTQASQIQRLETAARQIGNAHQHIELGDALREIEQFERAGESYAKALEKEPDNLKALWGAANVEVWFKRYEESRAHLARILDIDPEYKFGDASLAYGKSLFLLGRHDEAREHLEQHVKRWRHPEGLYILASVYAEQNRPDEAREQLEAMVLDINGSPRAIARKFGYWKSRAQKMLRRLG
jgi:hypothetical protein